MKMKHHVLVSLLSLCLIGCSNQTTPKDPDNTVEPTTPTTPTNPETPEPSPDPVDPTPVDPEPVNDTKWDNDTWALMIKYLGKQALPYYDLGNSIDGSWVAPSTSKQGYLKLSASISMDATSLNGLLDAYKTANWTIESSSARAFSATLEDKKLSVEVASDSLGFVEIDAYYDEDYNDKSITAWDKDIKKSMKASLHNHIVPFVYLGTTNMAGSYSDSSYTYTISAQNGKWDDKIIENAIATLKPRGYEIKETTSSYSSVVTATATLEDGCVLTIVIKSTSATNADYRKATYAITLKEGYDATQVTEWPANITQYFDSGFDKHMVPYVYLATVNPTVAETTQTDGKVTITGGDWDDRVLTDAKANFAKDTSWIVKTTTYNDADAVLAYKTFDDGCRLQIQIGNSKKGKAELIAHYEDEYVGSTTQTEWPTAVKTNIAKLDANLTIPFVYLNKDTPTSTYTASSSKLTISGDKGFNSSISEAADNAFSQAGWTTSCYMGVEGFNFVATYDDGENTFTATLTATSKLSTSVSLVIVKTESFSVPAEGAWSTDVAKLFTDNCNYTLPFVYLGKKTATGKKNSTTSEITITGGTWNDQIYTLFETALNSDTVVSWTVSKVKDSNNNDTMVATGTNTNTNMNYTVTLYSKSGTATLDFDWADVFDASTSGAWSDAAKTKMETAFGTGIEAPYVYLGTTMPTVTDTANYRKIEVTGGAWDDAIITNAQATFATLGYNVILGDNAYAKTLTAYKIDETKGDSFACFLWKDKTGKAMYRVFYGPAMTADTVGEWDNAVSDKFSTIGNYQLPYLSTGAKAMTASTNKNSDIPYLKLGYSGKAADDTATTHTFILKAAKTLMDAGWSDLELGFTNSNYFTVGLTLEQADGSHLYAYLAASSKTAATMTFTYTSAYSATQYSSWGTSIKTSMAKMLDGYEIPYFSLNKDLSGATTKAAEDSSGHYVTLTGGVYEDKMNDAMKAALLADTDHTYEFGYDYTTQANGKTFVATTTLADGKHITIKLYSSSATSYNYRIAKLQAWCY